APPQIGRAGQDHACLGTRLGPGLAAVHRHRSRLPDHACLARVCRGVRCIHGNRFLTTVPAPYAANPTGAPAALTAAGLSVAVSTQGQASTDSTRPAPTSGCITWMLTHSRGKPSWSCRLSLTASVPTR